MSVDWNEIFGLSVSPWELIIRGSAMYLFLFLVFRVVIRRRIGAVGIDTPSIDFGQSTDFATHVALMTNNIPAFENVADMSELPPTGATIVALPMKIEGGSGGPLRIVAHLPE